MAIPGAQPHQPQQPHAQQPYSPPPYGQQPPAGQAYAQQPTSTALPVGQFNPYAQPHPAPTVPPGPPSGPPARAGGPRWLWALGGVVIASATWAATLMATGALDQGADGATADFRGYRFHHDMCATAKLPAFSRKYKVEKSASRDPDGYSSRQKGLDVSNCSRTMIEHGETSRTPPTTYVSTHVEWHKKSDPAGEFASRQRTWLSQKSETYQYKVSPVKGFGDEAYLVKEQRADSLGSLKLEVRAGWMTYEMSWSWFGGGIDEDYEPPSAPRVTAWMKSDTRATLSALKKADSKEAPGRDPGA